MSRYTEREKEILEQIVIAERERDEVGREAGYNLANHRFWNADKKVRRLEFDLKVVRMRIKES